MGWQRDDIQRMADELGIDFGNSSSELDRMKKIAKSLGMENFNGLSNADIDELERRAKQKKKEQADASKANNEKNNFLNSGNSSRVSNLHRNFGGRNLKNNNFSIPSSSNNKLSNKSNSDSSLVNNTNSVNSSGVIDKLIGVGRNPFKSKLASSILGNLGKNKPNEEYSEHAEEYSNNPINSTIGVVVNVLAKKAVVTILPILGCFVVFIIVFVLLLNNTVSTPASEVDSTSKLVTDGRIITQSDSDNYIFVNNLIKIKSENPNIIINESLVTTVFYVISSKDDKYSYNDFSDEQIRSIVNAMYNNEGVYDEAVFRNNLNNILKSYFPLYSDADINSLIDEIYEIYDQYKSIYGQSTNYNNVCAVAGACSYSIKGISTGDRNISKNIDISNLKVRLMQGGSWNGGSCGGTWGLELPNEELVDFEKYVLGVAYAESGGNSFEALKAQIIAARNFALSRADLMGNTYGRKLYQENGQWILQITNCVSDQAYCDPDKGCSKDVAAGNQWGNVHSGINNPITYKPPLAENAPLRQAAMEVNGEILINSSGYIVYTPYTNTNQVRWNSMANSGSDYKQILLSDYGSRGATNIEKMSCNTDGAGCNEVVGDYATWLQSGQSWSGIQLGTSSHTISSAGCLVTSISMLIAKSGVPTNVNGPFNPGTFVQKMNSVGGIDGNGNFQWYKVSEAAPNFQFVSKVYVSGKTREEKLKVINDLVAQGYYVVVEVMGNTGQHWVAIDSVNGENIFMYDPATKYTDLWSRYNYNNTSAVAYFKVNG